MGASVLTTDGDRGGGSVASFIDEFDRTRAGILGIDVDCHDLLIVGRTDVRDAHDIAIGCG